MAIQQRRRRSGRTWIIALVIAALLLVVNSVRFYTDILWFQEVGFASILWTRLTTQFVVGALVGVFVGAFVWLNLFLAARIAPAYAIPRLEVIGSVDPLERYREVLGPFVGLLRFSIAGVVGLFAGLAASSAWQTVLLWMNRVPFGREDPLFHRDVGFYVFELPFLEQVLSWAWIAIFISLLAAIGAHFWHGSINPERGLSGVTSGALAHVSVLLGLLALVKAGQYWLGTYQLNFSPRGVVTGASYTDVNAHLPALRLLAVISVVSAILFLVNIRVRRVALPVAAVGIWMLTAVLAGAVWPLVVQRFVVAPQEPQREEKYIEDNIAATRAAFGLQDVEAQPFAVSTELSADDVRANETLLSNVRLWDPEILQRVYSQLQAIRLYYRFEDIDIDRYEIDGELRQVLLSPRELSLEDITQNRSWSNLHLQYTHGFGLVASLANETTVAGQPSFLVKDLPGTVASGAESLRIEDPARGALYFGEVYEPSDYSIVNSDQEEIDYPDEDEGVKRSRYQGEGGISVGSPLRRLAFAIRERDPNMLLSGLITEDSKILVYRNVRERVRRVAPFLSLDRDPYIAVVDGRPQWILDAYTSTSLYPYSQRVDSTAVLGSIEAGDLNGELNYVRNSVKVVIDAYDGSLTFYAVEDEPLVRAWAKAFPDLFTDEEPTPDLRAHFRYPEDLFNIQSEVYLSYHVTDALNFYAREDQWAIPEPETTSDGLAGTFTSSARVPPTYLLVQLPGEEEQEFVLTRPFTPANRRNMIAFMAARSDPDQYGELLTLNFPSERNVVGPSQVADLISQDEEISPIISLLDQGGSRVERGSLVILPIEESILYISPLFVSAEGEGIPELKKIVMLFGEQVVIDDTFEGALGQIFDFDAQPDEPTDGIPPPDEPTPGDGEATQVLRQARSLYDQAQEALADGDFETYGRLIEELGTLLEEAQA
ncbi:MAG TPA: UPF0182 family protein, partial [Actinomycetota bacterium]|nr:UPF0182 family protein [Actinomycetota bacterium]